MFHATKSRYRKLSLRVKRSNLAVFNEIATLPPVACKDKRDWDAVKGEEKVGGKLTGG